MGFLYSLSQFEFSSFQCALVVRIRPKLSVTESRKNTSSTNTPEFDFTVFWQMKRSKILSCSVTVVCRLTDTSDKLLSPITNSAAVLPETACHCNV